VSAVFIAIGNSDDKLPQREWAAFQIELAMMVQEYADSIHGDWYSNPSSIYQKACMCIEISDDNEAGLKAALYKLATEYKQNSIAWNRCEATEFIGPGEHQ